MATSGRTTFEWTMEFTPPGGVGSTVIFKSGLLHKIRPSAFTLDQNEQVASSVLTVRFPDALQNFNVWNEYNFLTIGSNVVLKVDGFTRFTGKVKEMKRNFSSQDRSLTIVCRDRMGELKDAVVDIDIRRDTFRKKINLVRRNPLSSIWLSVEDLAGGEDGAITVFAANGATLTRVTSAGHLLEDNEIIQIAGTTNYNGVYSIQFVDVNNFDILVAFVANDATGTFNQVSWIRPWSGEFPIIPLWINNPGDPTSGAQRILLSEYEILYEVGGIAFTHSTIRVIGDVLADEQTLDSVEDDVYADIVYFDTDDTSTMISNLIRLVLEQSEATGGLNWTEGNEYVITDETPIDILSGMVWNTQEGDGDAVSFLSNLYDDPQIGLAPSYWLRDFNGNGQVEARLVTQDNNNAIDVDIINNAQFPDPFGSIYSRAVLVNNDANRINLMRDATLLDIFPTGDFPEGDVQGVTETLDHPTTSAVGVYQIADGTSSTAWGYFANDKYLLDMILPLDKPLFRADLTKVNGEKAEIDAIFIKALFQFFGGETSHPILDDATTGEKAVNGIKQLNNGAVHEPMRITVEYSTDATATPPADSWYVISPSLYNVEMDIVTADAIIQAESLNIEARYVRLVINNPAYAKIGESNWDADAYRTLLWFINDFKVLGKGRVLDDDGDLPSVQFTDDPSEPCRYNLQNRLVSMYRPTLLKYLEACGLKYKTLVLENSDVWDFTNEFGDADDVGEGYKYMVSRLDEASKENEWIIHIEPRPDIRIGHTVYSSKLNITKFYLVHGSSLQWSAQRSTHMLVLSDHESVDGGEAGDCS